MRKGRFGCQLLTKIELLLRRTVVRLVVLVNFCLGNNMEKNKGGGVVGWSLLNYILFEHYKFQVLFWQAKTWVCRRKLFTLTCKFIPTPFIPGY